MMPRSKTFREKAYAALNSNIFGATWMILILCSMISGAITSAPGSISSSLSEIDERVAALVSIPGIVATVILSGPFSYALARMYHKVALGEKIKIPEVFIGFKENFGGSLVLSMMQNLFIVLWSMLFVIPGIVKSYAYSMAFFVQQESKGEKNWRACLDESIYLTKGYKGKLFALDLSFLGWYIVGFLCLGVGTLWVSVYHMEARALFYEELKQIKYGTTEEAVECASVSVDPDGVLIPPEPIEHPTTEETVSNVAPTAQEDTKDVSDEE